MKNHNTSKVQYFSAGTRGFCQSGCNTRAHKKHQQKCWPQRRLAQGTTNTSVTSWRNLHRETPAEIWTSWRHLLVNKSNGRSLNVCNAAAPGMCVTLPVTHMGSRLTARQIDHSSTVYSAACTMGIGTAWCEPCYNRGQRNDIHLCRRAMASYFCRQEHL